MKIEVAKPLELNVDDKCAINLARNHVSYGRSEHLNTRFHFIRDQVSKGRHCPTVIQEAYFLTKVMKHNMLEEMTNKIGLVSLEHLN